MQLTTLTTAILTFASAECISFGIPDSIKQIVLNNEQSVGLDTSKEQSDDSVDWFAKLREQLNYPKEGYIPEVVDAWSTLKEQFPADTIKKAIDDYNSQSKGYNQKPEASKQSSSKNEGLQRFETLSNDKYEDHSLRIKKSYPEVLNLDTVAQYTGYLDIDSVDKHFFYWFFESRNDPENDPVILWLNGGPGCSSSTGLFFELGPSLINSTLQPVYNPYSWNSNASVIFLDQPVNVGYSYSNGEAVKNTAAAAKDVFVFLELFFQKFPQFLNNKFHIAGESYAGHYIPSFAAEILNNADRSFELSSVLIGNGITDPLVQYGQYKPMACGEGGYKPVLSEESCEQMDKAYPKCAALTEICYKFQSALACLPATVYCENSLYGPYDETGLNPYDIRVKCEDPGANCYLGMDYVDDYLNLDYVKDAVGASNIDIYTGCSDKVFGDFIKDGDEMKPFQQYVAQLLEADVPVLLYAGDKDFICNWLGNHAWSDQLEYSDHEFFADASLKPWYNSESGKPAGEVKSYKHFSFLRVYDAGHMVPYDQPENALDMVNTWIHGGYKFN